MSRSRRLFFALWPDDPTRQALFHWQTHNLAAAVRWQHRADLHMTLHFLGAVDVERLDVLEALGRSIRTDPFSIVLDAIGYWPRPRVLFAAPGSAPAELIALHRQLAAGLTAMGLDVEARPYRPHVTLARKVGPESDPGPLRPLTWTVGELALVESRPGDAPLYHPLRRWPIG